MSSEDLEKKEIVSRILKRCGLEATTIPDLDNMVSLKSIDNKYADIQFAQVVGTKGNRVDYITYGGFWLSADSNGDALCEIIKPVELHVFNAIVGKDTNTRHEVIIFRFPEFNCLSELKIKLNLFN